MCNPNSQPPPKPPGNLPISNDSFPTRRTLVLPPKSPPPTVELRGEVDDWTDGRTLHPHPSDDGLQYDWEVQLPAGAYAYKYRVDGAWMLDPSNPRTRETHGQRNSVIVVGGTPEPVVFAPGLPFLVHHPRGGVVISALLRKGHGERLRVLWSEGRPDTDTRTLMRRVGEEGEHFVFRLHLPTSSSHAAFRFQLDDDTIIGQDDGGPFVSPPPPEALPAWFRDGVLYTVFVDRFRPAHDRDDWTADPGPDRPAGGHLDGITRSLDSLHELGVRILHLTPVHEAVSCHRYDVRNPFTVDPVLGGEGALRELLDQAHRRGMRVLLDFSFIHVGSGFEPYDDVVARGESSSFEEWFLWRRRGDKRVLRHYGKRADAPLLNLQHPEVQALVVRAAEHWAAFGIDGFRLDAAAQVPLALGRRIRDVLRARVADGIVVGEVVPEHAWRWHAAGVVDAATDFSFHRAVTSFVADRSIDAAEAATRLAGPGVAVMGPRSVHFLSTHDHNRFATLASVRGDVSRTPLGMLLLTATTGVPMLVYGEELGMAAGFAGLRPEGVWEDRVPMPWVWSEEQASFRALTRTLLEARRSHRALREGDLHIMYAEDRLLIVRRACGADVVDIVANASDVPVELDLEDDFLETLNVVASVGEVRVRGQSVALGPNAGLVAERKRRARRAGVEDPRSRQQREMRDRAFAAGASEVPARPTRIDFALTERCNLRCRHCINHSPERTRDRTARTLTHSVLDRIREDLAHASYFGFVHGGESLTAPIFFDVLDAIRSSRAGATTIVHVLSNGMMLTRKTVNRLIDAGVCSLSASIDGATAKTNDAIRLGSRLDRVIANMREAASIRKERGLDLRLGFSCVLTRENIGELDQLVDLVAETGVDWLKLEELVPSTTHAQLVMIDSPGVRWRGAVADAVKRGRERGLVVVDHTDPPRVWRCKLDDDPGMRSFLQADEYANRSEIHPCRTAWELACVEPNGDVRVGSFHGPVMGNVMAESLLDMWNGLVARSERVRSRNERICGSGPVTCL